MKTTFPFQIQNVVFIFQTKSKCRNSKRDFRQLNSRHFWPSTSDTKIDCRQCRSVGSSDTGVGTPSSGRDTPFYSKLFYYYIYDAQRMICFLHIYLLLTMTVRIVHVIVYRKKWIGDNDKLGNQKCYNNSKLYVYALDDQKVFCMCKCIAELSYIWYTCNDLRHIVQCLSSASRAFNRNQKWTENLTTSRNTFPWRYIRGFSPTQFCTFPVSCLVTDIGRCGLPR